MRKIALIAIIPALLLSSCTENKGNVQIPADVVFNPQTANENSSESKTLPEMTFEYIDFDFGLIFPGEVVIHKYKFTNTGGSPLVISNVTASCGCTIPTYSKEPIAPGEEGFVEVKFDSSGRKGIQNKSVVVLTNTQPNRIELSFIAEIDSVE